MIEDKTDCAEIRPEYFPKDLRSYTPLTPRECLSAGSEIEKFRHLILPYTILNGMPQPGIEIASGGATCVPWAWSLELPKEEYAHYNSNNQPRGPIQIRGHADVIPIENDSLFFVSCSHLIEDLSPDFRPNVIHEFKRVIRPGGYIIIAVPEHDLWWQYVKNGGVHNHAHHQPQPRVGDISELGRKCGLIPIHEQLTNCYPGDHSILCVLQKPQ